MDQKLGQGAFGAVYKVCTTYYTNIENIDVTYDTLLFSEGAIIGCVFLVRSVGSDWSGLVAWNFAIKNMAVTISLSETNGSTHNLNS